MARRFNGTSDYLTTSLTLGDLTALTVAVWVRSTTATGDQVPLTTNYSGGNVACMFCIGGSPTGAFEGFAFFNSGGPFSGWRKSGLPSDIRGDGLWHRLIGVFDGNGGGSLTCYIDGSSATSSSNGGTTPSSSNGLEIGRYGNDSAYFGGDIADLTIWSVVLSASELTALNGGILSGDVRPESQLVSLPLMGDDSPEPDMREVATTRYAATLTSGTTKANHAPVEPWSRRWWSTYPTLPAVAPTNTAAVWLLKG